MNGYILLSRSLVESDIWRKPPLYLKVWSYLLLKAQYKPYKQLERGQLFISIPEIQKACTYYAGYRKEVPTKDQIFKILEWLRNAHESNDESSMKEPMITTTKATHGMIVTICNFNVYQCPENYEVNGEGNDESSTKELRKKSTANNINKESTKNVKNEKKYIDSLPSELQKPVEEFILNRKAIKKPMTDKAIELMLKELNKLSGGDIQKSIKILEQSIRNGWVGIFLLKEQQSGNPFLDRLRKEKEDEPGADTSNTRNNQTIFSKLLQEPK